MIEVLKQALEAFEIAAEGGGVNFHAYAKELRQAIAELEGQEPVAIDWERIAKVQNAKLMAMCDEAGGFEKLCEVMNKYKATHPPQRTWVGLTDMERQMTINKHGGVAWETAIAIEQQLKGKNI